MNHVSVLLFRCPTQGAELSTGIEMDAATFEQLPDIRSQIKCPVSSLDHISRKRTWLGNSAPSAPALAWLFINNRCADND